MQESGYLHRHRDDLLLWWMGFGIGGVGGKPEVSSDVRLGIGLCHSNRMGDYVDFFL